MKHTSNNALLQWYHKHGRHDLPWRKTSDPYPIWISEIMLQQTQVKTVLERFYFPFLEAFPTLEDLASASLDDVLKKWEGLGYYTRARNLHRAAVQCGTQLPNNAQDLQKLPGIGRSTAHAIAAFAYREPLPILDANVKRILHRFFALKERNEKKLWEHAYALFDATHPFEYNQAMMDLGAMVCLSKKPLCDLCPFASACQGKNSPFSYPQPKAKSIKPIRRRIIMVYKRANRYALSQRQERFLSGLWGFLQYEEIEMDKSTFLGHITQVYSHFTLEGDVYLSESEPDEENLEWFSKEEFAQLSLSRADHKVISAIN